jgi:stage IV sporulation protein FB
MNSKPFSWAMPLGRWGRVDLNVHIFFLLFAACAGLVEWHYLSRAPGAFGTALVTVAVVFVIAILHELAHAVAAVNLGGSFQSIVVTPWGGPSEIVLPPQPRARLVVHLAGPFLNLVLFALGAFLLIMTDPVRNSFGSLINPLSPQRLQDGLLEISLIQIATWVNFQMLVCNLLIAPPFDANRILRSIVNSINPEVSELRLEAGMMWLGCAMGMVLIGAAWLLRDVDHSGLILPTWFVLVVAGICVVFSSRHEFHLWAESIDQNFSAMDELMDYDPEGVDSGMFGTSGHETAFNDQESLNEWMADQATGSELAERSVALEEERRVDLILEKLHKHGLERLNEDERAFLERISQQYRRRRKQ